MRRHPITRRRFLKRAAAAALGAGLGSGLAGCGPGRSGTAPNVVLVTLDTTRADHLGCYGYGHRTSPNLDALASKSVVYTRAIATSSWTLPAHASLFTGKLTWSHGAGYDPEGPLRLADAIQGPESWQAYRARGLAPGEATLARILSDGGYVTGGVVAGPWMKRIFGLHKGFDRWDDEGIGTVNGRRGWDVTRRALEWVSEWRDRKFFLFLNYFDPHSPYDPPEGVAREFLRAASPGNGEGVSQARLKALYDGEIHYADYCLGHVIGALEEEGLLDRTVVVVTADHGELLGEHGRTGHGLSLHQEEIHVPLIVSHPGAAVAPGRDDSAVQLTDVFRMILDSVGLPAPAGIQAGLPPDPGHPVVAEVYPPEMLSPDGHWRALLEGGYKYLWNSRGDHRLFDLASDPQEGTDLHDSERGRAERMKATLDAYLEGLPVPDEAGPAAEVDDETREALESLGYVK